MDIPSLRLDLPLPPCYQYSSKSERKPHGARPGRSKQTGSVVVVEEDAPSSLSRQRTSAAAGGVGASCSIAAVVGHRRRCSNDKNDGGDW